MLADYLDVSDLRFDPEARLWLKREAEQFAYSDGKTAEGYVQACVASATDLHSESFELERRVRDWPSEYHLSRRRAQLLKNFSFDRHQSALEIGCGCGAITHFLGETFSRVVSVEGSERRARIARSRTRDLPQVEIVCAPMQELRWRGKFDYVFVIGVLEYAASFTRDPGDPYATFLRRCAECLSERGVLVLAIENQFGLKYFAGMGEDHTHQRFDGLEGYSSQKNAARTFGKTELQALIQEHFACCEFFYPYPDYKVPAAVLSQSGLQAIGGTGLSNLVSGLPMRDYVRVQRRPLFDEALVSDELARNQMASFFAPSFLVVAGKPGSTLPAFEGLGVMYSAERKPEFQTRTRIVRAGAELQSHKQLLQQRGPNTNEIAWRGGTARWLDQPSLALSLRRRRLLHGVTLARLFEPCAPWFDWLRTSTGSPRIEGTIAGRHFDAIWKNTFIDASGRCQFIDQEWCWPEAFNARVLIIRSAYDFIHDRAGLCEGVPVLREQAGRALIAQIAELFGVRLSDQDFSDFVGIEARLRELVFAHDPARAQRALRLKLAHPRVAERLTELALVARSLRSKSLVERAGGLLRRRVRFSKSP